ncbi:MAG: YggS family pyridoxal phosphate-dependent enzyme [Armatimonadia bacterium]|nr:YggS family pyridoxal phosphate-dependent enzyme [Armatimonadia bacterium]
MGSPGAEGYSLAEAIGRRVEEVQSRIASACDRVGRDPAEVTLVAVTKTRTLPEVEAVLAAGVGDVGENYVQRAMERVESLGRDRCRWHLIGHLQSNKARHAVAFVDWLHTIDSEGIADEVGKRARRLEREIDCMVEVNVAGEDTKYGVGPDELRRVYEHAQAVQGIAMNGLMTIAPFVDDPEEVRSVFTRLREMRDALRDEGLPAEHLSMGMTGDYEVAVEEGSTMVRIGTALFGPRSE